MKNTPARLWILPAKEAPVALVIRRKPHSVWHFLRWDTMRGTVMSGDWLWGLFYPKGCDVSWDGRLWTYHGDYDERGSGIAPIANLDPLATWYSQGAWDGGGFFESATCLRYSVTDWDTSPPHLVEPGTLGVRLVREPTTNFSRVEDLRLERDGWQGGETERGGESVRWQQPSPAHPRLVMAKAWTQEQGYLYEFSLPSYPGFLDGGVFRATYDAWGDLLVSRRGVLERYTLADIEHGTPSFAHDMNDIPGAPSPEALKRHDRASWASEREDPLSPRTRSKDILSEWRSCRRSSATNGTP